MKALLVYLLIFAAWSSLIIVAFPRPVAAFAIALGVGLGVLKAGREQS